MSDHADRWAIAQEYEHAWWRKRAAQLNLDFYREYAEELLELLDGIKRLDQRTAILEIGSGAAGILTHLSGAVRCAVDPLEDFYRSVPEFRSYRDSSVTYAAAKAESLLFADAQFDLVICDNVLDHCDQPETALAEMARVMKPDGILYLRLVTYHVWGRLVRAVLERLRVDRGHPHTFTKSDCLGLFVRSGLGTVTMRNVGFARRWLRDLTALQLKRMAKAVLFATQDKTLYILEKQRGER